MKFAEYSLNNENLSSLLIELPGESIWDEQIPLAASETFHALKLT